jgi:hypothetical protein
MREIFPHFGVTLLHCAKNKGVLRLFVIIWAFTHKVQCKLQAREYLGWIFPLSCVHSVMMVFSAQLNEGGGSSSTPFHSIYPLPSKTITR